MWRLVESKACQTVWFVHHPENYFSQCHRWLTLQNIAVWKREKNKERKIVGLPVQLSLHVEHLCVYPPATLQLHPLIFMVSPIHIWLMCSVAPLRSEPHWADLRMTDINTHRTYPNTHTRPRALGLRIVLLVWARSQRHLCKGKPHFLPVCVCEAPLESMSERTGRTVYEGKHSFTHFILVGLCAISLVCKTLISNPGLLLLISTVTHC